MTSRFDFAALDVETANQKYGSICSIGVAVVRNGIRIKTRMWLCRPPAGLDHFAPRNIAIHKITPGMVAAQPTFEQRLPEVLATIGSLPVVAHNAAFDMAALHQACAHSGINTPSLRYGCTKVWSRRILPYLPGYGLKDVTQALGIRLTDHHSADADAAAAADITLALAVRAAAHDLPSLTRTTGTHLGTLNSTGNIGCR